MDIMCKHVIENRNITYTSSFMVHIRKNNLHGGFMYMVLHSSSFSLDCLESGAPS